MNYRSTDGIVPLAVIAGIALVGVVIYAVSPAGNGNGQNAHFWNPTTWFTHKPADKVDAAKAKAETAKVEVQTSKDAAIHSAHIEFKKASVSQSQIPQSPAADLDRRFTANGLGVLDQIDPLSAKESADALAIVQGALSQEIGKRQSAEAAQQLAEKQLGIISDKFVVAQADLKTKDAALADANANLRKHFDTENALANQERNTTFLMRLAAGLAIVVIGIALYLRMGLGSVGAGVHELSKILPADQYQKVVSTLDSGTDWIHQQIIAAGKKKAQALELAAQHVLGVTPNIPPSSPTQI